MEHHNRLALVACSVSTQATFTHTSCPTFRPYVVGTSTQPKQLSRCWPLAAADNDVGVQEPLDTDQQVQDWLKWFTMHAPLTCLSTLVTDNLGTDFRLEHTHFFSAHGQGGHYHYDLTPEHVEYHGYFMPCERIFRVAKP